MLFKSSLLVAILAASAFAVPTGHRSSCSAGDCAAIDDKFFYEIGHIYEYKYTAETRTAISEDDNQPGIRVEATVKIHPITPCEYILALSDVTTDSPSRSEEFSTEVTKNSLKFTLQNGKVETICPSPNEPIWVLNFKKGILSTFQNSMKTDIAHEVVTETDISGVCRTIYESEKHDNMVITKKTKVPAECTKKPHASTHMSSFGFNLDSIVEGMNQIKSEQQCTHVVTKKILNEATCEEVHTFRPFSGGGAGKVFTSAKTSLNLINSESGPPPFFESFDVESDLSYKITHLEELEDLHFAEEILSKLETASHDIIEKEVPQLFSELVSSMKKLTHSQLTQLFMVAEGKPVIKFMYDAMPLVGTLASNEYITELILKGKYSDEDKSMYYTSLALIKNPPLEMFKSLWSLLSDNKMPESKAMLGISSAVHNYCESHDDCTSVYPINEIIHYFESYLGVSCRSTYEEEKNMVLLAIKSLGNVGKWFNAESILNRCFMKDNPTEIRIAAIEAWRRTPCSYNRNQLLVTYEDSTYDSELRIAAYLQVMKCPTKVLVDTIKDRLNSEGVNQVSSFVWSHLNNIQESAAPDKQWIRELIGEDFLKEKYTPDALKFSRYLESSLYSKELNVGGSADADVIFSTESFIPRSAMLNMTVNLFGKSVNLFEIGGRIEGYEHFIEKFFGPNGYFPDETIEQIIKNLRDDKFEKSPELAKLIGQSSTDPKGSMFFRLLGNELFYTSHLGSEDILSQLGFKSPMDLIIDMLTKRNINFMKTFNIVKSKFTVPTITGFPLQVNYDGTATVGFVLDGDFKFDNLNTFELQGRLKPSIALNIDSSMIVDAFVTKTGRKFTTTLHSSTIVEGKAVVNNLKLVDFSVHVPEKDMTLYEYSHNTLRIEDGEEHLEDIGTEGYRYCHGEALGIQLCSSYVLANTANYPELLSSKFAIEKTDTHTSYDFHFLKNDDTISILFDMPNSKKNKKYQLLYYFDGRNYEGQIHSPHMHSTIKGIIDLQNKDKKLTFQLLEGSKSVELYGFEATFENKHTRTAQLIKPAVMFTMRGKKALHIEGLYTNDFVKRTIEFEASSSFTDTFKIFPTTELKVVWNYGDSPKDVNIKFSSYHGLTPAANFLTFELTGSSKLTEQQIAFMLDGHYQMNFDEKKQLHVSIDLERELSPGGNVYKMSLNAPYANTNVELTLLQNHYGLMINFIPTSWKFHSYYISRDNDEEKLVSGKIWMETHNSIINYGVDKTFVKTKDGMQSTTKIGCGYDCFIEGHHVFDYGKRFYSKVKAWAFSTEMEFIRKEKGIISIEGSLKSNEVTGDIKGIIEDRSIKDIVDWRLKTDVTHRYGGHSSTYTIHSYLTSDRNEFALNLNAKRINRSATLSKLYEVDNLIQITAKATPSSIYFSSNMIQPFKIIAKFINEEGFDKIEAEAHYGDNVVEIMGGYSPKKIEGSFKSNDKMISFDGQLTKNGLESFIKWAPDQYINIMAKYKNDADTERRSLMISVQTPFAQWKKQEATISYQLNSNHIDSLVNIIWRNTEHLNFSIKMEGDIGYYPNQNFSGRLSCTSSIPNFERILLNIEHRVTGSYNENYVMKQRMDTNIEGEFGFSKSTAKLTYALDGKVCILNFNVNSPLIKPLNLDYQSNLTYQKYEHNLELSYGLEKSIFKMTANFIDLPHIMIFKADCPYLPQIEWTLGYDKTDYDKYIATTTLLANDKNIIDLKLTGSTRASLDFTVTGTVLSPLSSWQWSINSNLVTNNGIIEFDFDMSPVIGRTKERMKFHAKANLPTMSPYNIYIVSHYSGYGSQYSGSISHKIDVESYEMKSEIRATANSFSFSTFAEAFVDTMQLTGSLTATIKSSLENLKEVVITARHELEDNTRNTLIRYENGGFTSKAFNSIVATDAYNWNNVLIIGSILKTTSKMSSTKDNHFITELDWNIGEYKIISKLNKYPSGELQVKASLSSPYNPFIQIQATHEFVGEKKVLKGSLFYGKEKITSYTEYLMADDYIHVKHEISSKQCSWTPFQFELDINMKMEKQIKVSAAAGKIFGMSMKLFDKEDVYGGEILFEDRQTGEKISLEARHIFRGKNKQIYIQSKINEKLYLANIEYSQLQEETTVTSEFKIPHLTSKLIKTSLFYNFHTNSFNGKLIIGVEVYGIVGTLKDNVLIAEITKPNGKVDIAGEWSFTKNKAELKLHLDDKEHNAEMGFKFSKVDKTEGTFYVICNGKNYRAKSILDDKSISFFFQTPEDTYKMVSELNTVEETAIKIILSKNSDEIIIKGKGQFDNNQGSAIISMSTPFDKIEETFASITYRLTEVKEFKVECKIGDKNLFAHLIQDPINVSHGYKTVFEIKLPIKNYEEISIVNIYEHGLPTNREEITLSILKKQIASAKLIANDNDVLQFSFEFVDITLVGKFQIVNGIDFTFNFNNGKSSIKMELHYDMMLNKFKGSLENNSFKAVLFGSGSESSTSSDVSISFKTYKSMLIADFEGHFSFDTLDEFNMKSIFKYNGKEYFCKYSSSISSENGHIMIDVKAPFIMVNEFSINGEYQQNDEVKIGKLTTVFNQIEQIFSAELKNFRNKFSLKLRTPFYDTIVAPFTNFKIEGEYDHAKSFYKIKGEFYDNEALTIEGEVTPTISGYLIKAKIPTTNGHATIDGELKRNMISIKIIDPFEAKQFFTATYEVSNSEIYMQMDSSYSEYKHLTFYCHFNYDEIVPSVVLKIEKDDSVFNAEIKLKLKLHDHYLKIYLENNNNEHFKFEWGLDCQSLEKSMTVTLDSGEIYHFFEGKLSFKKEEGHIAGIIKAKSSFEDFKNFHFEGIIKSEEKKLSNQFRLYLNDYDISLNFNVFEKENIYQVTAEFENNIRREYQLSFEFLLNTRMNMVTSKMSIGEKEFKILVEFTNESKKLEARVDIKTPYNDYNHILFNVLYELTGYKNIVEVGIHNNIPIVLVKAVLSTDIKNPEINVVFNSVYTESIEVLASLNIEDTSDFIKMRLKLSDSNDYAFGFGYAFNAQRFAVSMKLKCPHNIFGKIYDFDLAADFKFEEGKNYLKLYFERNGEVHIDVDGVFFEDETSVSIHMPNDILGNFHTRGTFNREKRSLEMQMMNDHHTGGIVANFHSLKINLQTPFKRIQKLSFSLAKPSNDKWVLNYKRNDNYLDYEFSRSTKGVETKIDLSLPSWELLALTGRLTEQEIEGYLTGKLPETKLTFTGKGLFGRKKGSAKYEMNSPGFPTLKKATAKFDYNVRKGMYTFDAKSSTNKDFKIFLQFKRGGLFIDVFVPHTKTPTIAKGQLTIFKGKLNISSRFPAIKSYKLEYSVEIRKIVSIKWNIERNGIQVFNLEFHKEADKSHFLVERRRQGVYFKFHYHREGWHHLDVVIHRNGHELSANLKGSGNLPQKGQIDFVIKNSFRLNPREISGSLKIDRTGSPKRMVLKVEKSPGKVTTVTALYNINLNNLKKGDLNLQIDTPEKIDKRWKNIKLEWQFDATKTGHIKLNCGDRECQLKGKLSLRESDFVLSCNIKGVQNRAYGWKYERNGNYRDYLVKFGPEKSYTLLTFTGTISDIRNADIQGRIKSRFAKHELKYSARWSGNKEIGISGDGTFEIGNKKGAFKLHRLKRDPIKRASTFKLTGTSNMKGFSSYSIIGEYNLSERLIDVKFKWDTDELSLYTKIDNFTRKKSQNSATFNIPGVGPSQINFGHDFTNPLDKTIKVDGHLGGKDFHYYEHWTRNEKFTLLSLDVDIKSNFIGVIKMAVHYDVRDVNNAKGQIIYTRNGKNNVNVDWHRTKTDNSIVNEITINSKSRLVPNSKAYFKANWESEKFFASSIGIEWAQKKIEAVLNVDKKMAKFYTKTPFPNIDDITAVLKYDLQTKIKTITLNYERGQKKVNFSFVLNYKSKSKGSLDISLTTPFKVIKKVMFNAKWNKGKFNAHYQRNDKKIDVVGKADIKQGKSSYDFVFTPKSGKPIHIKLNYDLVDFVKRTSKKEQQILHLDIETDKYSLSVNVDGYRSKEKIILNIVGTSSLDMLKTFRLRLDSELNLSNREGLLDLKINDFEYKMKNKFEKFENGFYFRTQIHSTLTRLPGLTLGYGKDGTARTVTFGYGDEREISITLNGKDKFKKGLFGKIDIPRRGIMGIEYDINYDFIGDDKLSIKAEIRLKNGKKINYELDYHSDGVKTRIGVPIENIRRLRSKRSTNDDFNIKDYSIAYQSSRGNNVLNKGFIIEGQVCGKPFSVNTYINLKELSNAQGKLLIQTPLEGYEKLGGYFTVKQEGQKLRGSGEIYINGHTSFEFETNMKDRNSKSMFETEIDNETPVFINLISKMKDINIKLKHGSSMGEYNIDINLHPQNNGHHLTVACNQYLYDIEYVFTSRPLNVKLYSTIYYYSSIVHKGEIQAHVDDEGYYFTTYISTNQKLQNINIDAKFSKSHQNIEVTYNNIVSGRLMTIAYKNSYNRKQVILSYHGTTILNFDLHKSSSRHVLFEINSVHLPTINLSTFYESGVYKAHLEINSCLGALKTEIAVSHYDTMIKIQAKYMLYSTPTLTIHIFGNRYGYELLGKITNDERDDYEYIFNIKGTIRDQEIKFYLELPSPVIERFEKSFVDVRVSLKKGFKLFTEIFVIDVSHKIDFEAANEPKMIAMNIISPLVPTGYGKVRLFIEGKSIIDSKTEVVLSNAENSYFCRILSQLESLREKKVDIFLRTPLVGFEEFRFGGGYKNGMMNEAYIYADPFNYKAEFFVRHEIDRYNVGFEVAPGNDLPTVAAEAVIPYNKISPHFSAKFGEIKYDVDFTMNNTDRETELEAMLTYNGQINGGKIYVKKIFPIELEYKFIIKSEPIQKFHIMADSSFYTVTNAVYLLL